MQLIESLIKGKTFSFTFKSNRNKRVKVKLNYISSLIRIRGRYFPNKKVIFFKKILNKRPKEKTMIKFVWISVYSSSYSTQTFSHLILVLRDLSV